MSGDASNRFERMANIASNGGIMQGARDQAQGNSALHTEANGVAERVNSEFDRSSQKQDSLRSFGQNLPAQPHISRTAAPLDVSRTRRPTSTVWAQARPFTPRRHLNKGNGIMVGYGGSTQYRIWDPLDNKDPRFQQCQICWRKETGKEEGFMDQWKRF